MNTLVEIQGHLKDQDPFCWGLQLSVGGIIVLNCLSLKFFPLVSVRIRVNEEQDISYQSLHWKACLTTFALIS